MIFENIDNECLSYLEQLFSMQEKNIDYILAIRNYLENPKPFPNKEKEFQYAKNAFSNDLCNYLNIDDVNMKKHLNKAIISSNLKYFQNNEYLKRIGNKTFLYKDWELKIINIPAYQGFVFDDLYAQGDSCYITARLSFADFDYSYPSISLCGREWMSLHPNEISTMKVPISACKGKVLVLGLGMGYFAFMASQKDSVKEVHILEMDKDVIDLFNRNFLPLFDHPEKIHIHKADALDYIQNVGDGDYTYIFSDLWHDTSDGIPCYISLLKQFGNYKNTRCYYWIEDSILSTYRLYVIGVLRDLYENYTSSDYNDEQTEIYNYLKNIKLHSKEEISSLLTVGGLKNIILNNK